MSEAERGVDEAAEDGIDRARGEQLLHALERILESPAAIQALVRKKQAETGAYDDPDAVAPHLIAHYSNRSALVGGATAIPAMLPGLGTVATLLAGPLADMVLLLKLEAEMCLALAAARGHDIARPDERQLALLLATVSTAEVSRGRNPLRDAVDVSGTAIWNYTPRRVGKLLVEALAVAAAWQLSRRVALRALPVIGVAVGAGMNKALTTRVGRQAWRSLQARAHLTPAQP